MYSGITGLSVKTSHGHKHKIAGRLNIVNSHCHYYENYTHENIEYKGGKTLKRVLS
nr:YmaF family protein [Ruminiclostridium cellulolyticum]